MEQKYPDFFLVGADGELAGVLRLVNYDADVPVHLQRADAKDLLPDLNRQIRQGRDLAMEIERFCERYKRGWLPSGFGHGVISLWSQTTFLYWPSLKAS